MKLLKLKRQKHDEPEFDELSEMLFGLNAFLDEEMNFNDSDWNEKLSAILDFQDSDGSFRLLDSYDVPSDARVDFCHMPTYICTAILMKAYMMDCDAFPCEGKSALSNGLRMSCARNLRGHGYGALKGQIEALKIFMKAGLREFLDLHDDLSPGFCEMVDRIISNFRDMESNGEFLGPWGESYEDEIRAINGYFNRRNVFVYGTLMSGETNHGHLKNSTCLGKAVIEGYDMYNVGWYPAIVPGENMIVGELYQVPINDLPSIDILEGDGYLYIKKCESVTCADGKTAFALVYVYIEDCSDLEGIPAWNEEYVWYVSYGSNMLRERLMCYIEGGSFKGSTERDECKDTTPPVAVKNFELPHGMYFGNRSSSWQGGGVSFLDMDNAGKALGVAYLMTRDQFDHVAAQENGGKSPHESNGWYTDVIDLGEMDGFEVKTLTNRDPRPYNRPCQDYLDTVARGIKQNWPEMSDDEIKDYLESCIR